MLIYSIDQDFSCREMIKVMAEKTKNISVKGFRSPFSMLKGLIKDKPDVIVISYDFIGYKLPSRVFKDLGDLNVRFILVSTDSWEDVSEDLVNRGITTPANFEYVRQGGMDVFNKLKEITSV